MTGPNPILDALQHDWQRLRHPHHHDQPGTLQQASPAVGRTVSETAITAELAAQTPAQQPATTATATAAAAPSQEDTMSVVTDVRNDLALAAHDLAAKAAEFEQSILPAAAAKLTALEGNPVIDALLTAVHVPVDNLDIVVAMINKLESIWAPPQTAEQPQQQPVPAAQ
jgi:hypothetical protein